jgi:hypothetical protein
LNLWYPIGILISLFVVYWSFKDDQTLRADPDDFLLRSSRGESLGFYLTIQSAVGRVMRMAAPELAQIEDAGQRQQLWEKRILQMPRKRHILHMTLWEIRFRLVAFTLLALFLLYDLLW